MGLINLLTDLNSFYQNNPYSQQYAGGSQYATPPAAIAKGSFDQKSLKYGDDRQGGGSSNEPYITTPIPDGFMGTSPDFILRGGILNPDYVRNDVSRLTKFFTDIKSPKGNLFVAKQELLERQNTIAPGAPNRIYNPLGTIAQAGVLDIGWHLNKRGFDPFYRSYFLGGREGYYYYTKEADFMAAAGGVDRLVLLYKSKQTQTPTSVARANSLYDVSTNNELLFSYNGGPNSVGGFGKTNIRITSDRTGLISDRIKNNPKYIIGSNPKWLYNPSEENNLSNNYVATIGEINDIIYTDNLPVNILNRDNKTGLLDFSTQQKELNDSNNVQVFNGQQILDQTPHSKNKNTILGGIVDYRAIIHSSQGLGNNNMPFSNYATFNRETTYSSSVTTYRVNRDPINPNKSYNWDGLNSLGVVQGKADEFISEANKDLVKFFFEINNNDAQTNTQNWFLFFRAYLNNLSDNYQPEWQSYKYVGRGENFYKYSGFTRTMQLSFTIYAHSREEMLPIYEKINYLVGTTAPDYSDFGLMRGNFINLTVGDYLDAVPGIITSIALKPSFEAGWDLNRDENGTIIKLGNDLVGQLPRMIDVDLGFTPIHSFTPQFGKKFVRNIPTPQEALAQALRFQPDESPDDLITPA